MGFFSIPHRSAKDMRTRLQSAQNLRHLKGGTRPLAPTSIEENAMRIGIPAEVKNNETRVAATPSGVHALAASGHDVVVQAGAGLGSSFTDEEYADLSLIHISEPTRRTPISYAV